MSQQHIEGASPHVPEADPTSQSDRLILPGQYMPMTPSAFCGIDLEIATPDEWRDYMRMKFRPVRDRNETDEAREYFDAIQGSLEESFKAVTLETLRDPTKMNLVRCVDKNSNRQLDEQDFGSDEQIKLAGGLAWLDITGTMSEWVTARIFNDRIAAGVHRNCGGLAIVGCLTGERQALARTQARDNATRLFAETASVVRSQYVRRMGSRIDPDVARVIASFSGPELIFSEGPVGTAEDFVTPKLHRERDVEDHFTPREVRDGVEKWAEQHLANRASE